METATRPKHKRNGAAIVAVNVWGMCRIARMIDTTSPQQARKRRINQQLLGVSDTHREELARMVDEQMREGFGGGIPTRQPYHQAPWNSHRVVDDPHPAAFLFLTVECALLRPAPESFRDALPVPAYWKLAYWVYALGNAKGTFRGQHHCQDRPETNWAVDNRWKAEREHDRMLEIVQLALTGSEHDQREQTISEEWAQIMLRRLRGSGTDTFLEALKIIPPTSRPEVIPYDPDWKPPA